MGMFLTGSLSLTHCFPSLALDFSPAVDGGCLDTFRIRLHFVFIPVRHWTAISKILRMDP